MTDTKPEPALLPCPHCGARAVMQEHPRFRCFCVTCTECFCRTHEALTNEGKTLVADAWNRRAVAPEVEALAKAARTLADAIVDTELHGEDHHDDGCDICVAISELRAALALCEGGGNG